MTRTIGLPWYRREDYPFIRDIMADPHNFAATYDQWLMVAENNERVAHQAGLETVRVGIEPASFAQWCAGKGLEPGSAARMEYVSERCTAP